eukprot:Opistho-2@32827
MFSLMRNAVAWMRERANRGRSITIVLLGIDNAGKSTVLAALKDEDTDFITPTFGFNSEELRHGRFKLTVYDLGGGKNLRGLWTRYLSEVHGAIYVVDASDPTRLEESREALNAFIDDERFKGKPLLVLANKQDKEGAVSNSSVSKKLKLRGRESEGEPIFVQVCAAKRASAPPGEDAPPGPLDERITSGLEWLISTIRTRHDELTSRISKDVAVQQEKEKIERDQREAIANLRRKERLAEEAKAAEEAQAKENGGASSEESDRENHPNALNTIATPDKPAAKKHTRRSTKNDDIIEPPAAPTRAYSAKDMDEEPVNRKATSRRGKRSTLDGEDGVGDADAVGSRGESIELAERPPKQKRRPKSTVEADSTHDDPPNGDEQVDDHSQQQQNQQVSGDARSRTKGNRKRLSGAESNPQGP